MQLIDEPVINSGNILIHDDDFILIDIRPQISIDKITETHRIALCLDYKIAGIMKNMFKFTDDEYESFLSSFKESFTTYRKSFSKFEQLHAWALRG